MNSANIVDIEPIQRPSGGRQSGNRLTQAELKDIAGSETLVLATAVAEAFLSALEIKERRRMRRFLVLIACGLAFFIGSVRVAVCLINS